jgi:quinol monooxygenase YgiN
LIHQFLRAQAYRIGPANAIRIIGQDYQLDRAASSGQPVGSGKETAMITEIATIEVKPGMAAEFEAGAGKARILFARAPGCHGMALHRVIEHPERFLLMVQWKSVAHHMERFRQSADFAAWRDLVGHCIAAPPAVVHSEMVMWPD